MSVLTASSSRGQVVVVAFQLTSSTPTRTNPS